MPREPRNTCFLLLFGLVSTYTATTAQNRTDTLDFRTCLPADGLSVRTDTIDFQIIKKDKTSTDTIRYVTDHTSLPADKQLESMPVMKSIFRRDWFVFLTGGIHTFRGDYSNDGPFEGTLSPEVGGGGGVWLNPYAGLSAEFIRSRSRGYSEYVTGHYGFGYGDILEKEDGTLYRKMKVDWWDASLSVMLNLTRLITGYEGYGSLKNRNQFILNLGIGCVHQLNYNQRQGSGYSWSGHTELQYSRFFGRKRRVSLDVRLRCLFYHTNFDYESKRHDRLIDRIDANTGIHAGMTFYFGRLREKKRLRQLQKTGPYDFRNRENQETRRNNATPVDYGTLTFHVTVPAEATDSFGKNLRFPDAETERLFREVQKQGVVTLIESEPTAGATDKQAECVTSWLKEQESFRNAMTQTFSASGKNISEKGSIKICIHYLMER